MDVNSIPDRIATLCRQESTTYRCESYLSPEFQRQHSNETTILEAFPSASPCTETPGTACNAGRINEFWREKICEWSYQVIDHFDFNREVVAVSLSYLDRFLCTRTVTKKVFQLAAMSSLYMAIKLYEPTTLKISSFIELSRGYFTVDHIIAMEETILRDLSWYMHPPTALNFVNQQIGLFELCKIDCSVQTQQDLAELSRFLCELSVCDYWFVNKKPSAISMAALMTAMDQIGTKSLSSDARAKFLTAIREVAKLDLSSSEVVECRSRLGEMYRQGSYNQDSDRGPSPNFVGDAGNGH